MSHRYDLPAEQRVPGKIQLALVTIAFFGVLSVLFFASVGILAFVLSWMGTALEAML